MPKKNSTKKGERYQKVSKKLKGRKLTAARMYQTPKFRVGRRPKNGGDVYCIKCGETKTKFMVHKHELYCLYDESEEATINRTIIYPNKHY